ncbi:MAG: type I 3-dehydroquinate dehydratase [Bradymonadales bacterium]|nr:type I 3-dehydroquinate dehydratase [Bradymonadales bacterium]
MLCITGADRSVEALFDRLVRHRTAELQEVRLDLLDGLPPSPDSFPVDPRRLLFACRPRWEGSGFEGEETQRLSLLKRAIEGGAGWVDIEGSTRESDRFELAALARHHSTRLLISHHEPHPISAAQIQRTLVHLAKAQGQAVKLAMTVNDAAELDGLYTASQKVELPAVLIGMGPAGLISRALYDRFGSPWTYIAASEEQTTAEGQLTVEQAHRFRLPLGPRGQLFVLLGGRQVLGSPGPRIYNDLFASRQIPACYLPVITERLEETLNLLVSVGLQGASVTMPHKRKAALLVDSLSEEARMAGVVNTITVEPTGMLSGDCTDGRGAVAALRRHCPQLSAKRGVILGNGATATAIAYSLAAVGVKLTILGRNQRKANDLAKRLAAEAGRLSDLPEVPFDLLVQATPVGSDDPGESLVHNPALLAGKIVLDVVLAKETRLMRDTRSSGGLAIDGRAMWAEQGRLQLARWLSMEVPAADLERDR